MNEHYAARLNIAARRACSTYLDAAGTIGLAEYDGLTEGGKAVWRGIVTRAVYDMLPVVRDDPDQP